MEMRSGFGFEGSDWVCHLEAAGCGAQRDATYVRICLTYGLHTRLADRAFRGDQLSLGDPAIQRSSAMKHLAGICRL